MQAAITGELGNVDKAMSCCQKVLSLDPEDTETKIMLSRLMVIQGKFDEALNHLNSALENDPESGEAWATLSGIHLAQGNYIDARNYAEKAILFLPDQVDGYLNLANALIQIGQIDDALLASSKAAELAPDSAQAFGLMGLAYERLANWEKSLNANTKAISLDPMFSSAYAGLIRTHCATGNLVAAEQILNQALKNQPDDAGLHCVAGALHVQKKDATTAETFYREALRLKPELVQAWVDLGNLLQNQGRHEEAEKCYAEAIRISPRNPEAHFNLGVTYQRRSLFDLALASFDKAIESRPEFVDAHWYKSFIHLSQGDYSRGWDEYEWRLRQKQNIPRSFSQPAWNGESLVGRTILVHDEQGYGDTFQFARYLPLVKSMGGKVIFECHPKLSAVLKGCPGYDEILERTYPPAMAPTEFDTQIHLLSLPRVLKTRMDSVPCNIPYIRPDSGRVNYWHDRIASDPNFKIGITWAGSANHTNELNRSCRLLEFQAISDIPGVSYYSLQKGPGQEQADNPPPGMNLIRIDRELDLTDRFVDTAALMTNLDLIISIDTSIVHLAGALGCPVWTLLCATPDWRWLQKGSDSPWYPTMRLFRQAKPRDWADVFSQVRDSLSLLQKRPAR